MENNRLDRHRRVVRSKLQNLSAPPQSASPRVEIALPATSRAVPDSTEGRSSVRSFDGTEEIALTRC
jgi:hypothetical protein